MPDLAVVGAGVMGAGIAESAAIAGLSAVMVDVQDAALAHGRETIEKDLERRLKRGRLSEEGRAEVLARISTATSLEACADVPLVIEAIVENLEIKQEVFSDLEGIVRDDAVLATNTSSLSVARIASATERPERVVGMHFFNPVPAMRLVEVVAAPATDPSTTHKAIEATEQLGKTPIEVSDTPGFVVNRVARPFYLEALRLVEAGGDPEQVDPAIRGAGFRMGPLQLAALIGMDINLAVSESLYERSYCQPRFRPSPIQRSMVETGLLGRKTGQGFYKYNSSTIAADEEESAPSDTSSIGLTVVGDPELAQALGVEPDGEGLRVLALKDEAMLAGSGAEVGARRITPGSPVVELVGDVDLESGTKWKPPSAPPVLRPRGPPISPGALRCAPSPLSSTRPSSRSKKEWRAPPT